MMNPRDQAIADCVYANNLGDIALNQHLNIWMSSAKNVLESEAVYLETLQGISDKLYTPDCLLRDSK